MGDVVLIVGENPRRNEWPKAIVDEVFPGKDGLVRRLKVHKSNGTVLERDVRKLCLLEAADWTELNILSVYTKKCCSG